MYTYKLYGLYVQSEIKINFLSGYLSKNVSPQIFLREKQFNECKKNDQISFSLAHIYRKNVGYFEIVDGKNISFSRDNKDVSNESIGRSLINVILGYCLYQREHFVMHASAIEINKNSFIFFGASGSGKSSLSADLYKNFNADLLSEDVACIDEIDNKFSIKHAPSFVKLSDNIADILNFDQSEKLYLQSDRLKRSLYPVIKKSTNNNLRACFFLQWGDEYSLLPMSNEKIIPAFLTSSFSAFPFNSCKKSSILLHKSISKISKTIPIYNLKRNKKELFQNSKEIFNFLEKFKD